MADADDLVTVARVVKTRGLRGELVADLLTDFPQRFDNLRSLIAVAPDGRRRSLQIEAHWFHRDRIVFKFAGFDSIEAAKSLIGSKLTVPVSERVKLRRKSKALLTILDVAAVDEVTLLSEKALEDWNRPEEDKAWAHLQSPRS